MNTDQATDEAIQVNQESAAPSKAKIASCFKKGIDEEETRYEFNESANAYYVLGYN
ncbi:hypothetical protein [Thalassotalea fusca]